MKIMEVHSHFFDQNFVKAKQLSLESLAVLKLSFFAILGTRNLGDLVFSFQKVPKFIKKSKFRASQFVKMAVSFCNTVWKFYEFSITQKSILKILEVQDLPFSTHLEAQNFDFYDFLHFLKATNHK